MLSCTIIQAKVTGTCSIRNVYGDITHPHVYWLRGTYREMDSGPTLDVVDYGFPEDEEDVDGEEVDGGEREVWGRLFPLTDAYSKTGTWV